MPCFGNGAVMWPKPIYPEHFRFDDFTTAASAESISISWVATKHCMMEQMIAHWDAVPTTSEYIILSKLSGVDARVNTILRQVDPSVGAENLTDLACVIPFYWDPGDTVRITYPNTEDQAVGVEIFLVEVF